MIRYKNLILIGSSHIAEQSINEIKNIIEKESPDIVAVELDRLRMQALLDQEKDKKQGKKARTVDFGIYKRVGIKGAIFAILGSWASRNLGNQVHVDPGSDMLTAIKLAKTKNIKIALIDRHIEETLKDFSKYITWKEKWNFLIDIVQGMFGKGINLDLTKVPEDRIIEEMMEKIKIRYPNVYEVLITKRNKIMAKKLAFLMKNHEKIAAVVGAGHLKGILEELKNSE